MHRWYPARGSMERTVETRPAQRSPTTSLTPLRPRSIITAGIFALGSIEPTVATSPAHRSPTTSLHALQAAFDHASDELLPAGRVLLHALGHADDLAVALRVDSDGDQDAHVLHVPAP